MNRLEKIEEKIIELEKKVYQLESVISTVIQIGGIETVLHMKDCCVLKQDQNLKKAD